MEMIHLLEEKILVGSFLGPGEFLLDSVGTLLSSVGFLFDSGGFMF